VPQKQPADTVATSYLHQKRKSKNEKQKGEVGFWKTKVSGKKEKSSRPTVRPRHTCITLHPTRHLSVPLKSLHTSALKSVNMRGDRAATSARPYRRVSGDGILLYMRYMRYEARLRTRHTDAWRARHTEYLPSLERVGTTPARAHSPASRAHEPVFSLYSPSIHPLSPTIKPLLSL
jgi:hypothetical protein